MMLAGETPPRFCTSAGGRGLRPGRARPGASYWAVLAFLVAFVALLLAVTYLYLLPAFQAAAVADDAQKRQLKAVSLLVLAVVLFVLLAMLLLTLRPGRLLLRRPAPRTRTSYVDAWAESGKRVEVPREDEDSR